jgi:hypothetical protein
VLATPTTPISSTFGANLCPATSYGSKYVSIPAPGTGVLNVDIDKLETLLSQLHANAERFCEEKIRKDAHG